MKKPMIYQYDKRSHTERFMDIYDVCRKNNLYEFKNDSGEIIEKYHNFIERMFSIFENNWNPVLNKVEHNEPLSDDDENFLAILMVLQFLRMPDSLSSLREMIQKLCQNENYTINENDLDVYIKASMFMWSDQYSKNNFIINTISSMMLNNKKIIIYKSKKPFIFNGTRPILHMKLYYALEDRWYLPISKHYCLSLVDEEANTPLYLPIPDAMTDILNTENIANKGHCIYGSISIKETYNPISTTC